MNNRDSQDRKPTNSTTDGPNTGEKERIRGRMKMVIGQLEGILQELKEVAKELRDQFTSTEEKATAQMISFLQIQETKVTPGKPGKKL